MDYLPAFGLQMLPPFAHIAHYVRYPPKGWGANGESEGKAPQGPAPLRAAQRNLIYGKAGPEGLRFHMRIRAP